MEQFLRTLDERAAQLRSQAQNLMEQSQIDDANLTKIQANLHEICATIGRVVCRSQPQENWRTAYLQKLDQLPCSWEAGLQQAEAHGDGRQMAIQQLKLETLASIRSEFCGREELI